MTRKDYVLLAAALREARVEVTSNELYTVFKGWKRAVDALADALAKDNPRFDRDRFLAACDEEEKPERTPIVYAICPVGSFKAYGDVRYSSREAADIVAGRMNKTRVENPMFHSMPWDPVLNVAIKEPRSYGRRKNDA